MRATLELIGKLTKQHEVSVDDIKAVLALGVTKQQIHDAFNVAFCFNVIDRLADAFEFFVTGPEGFAAGAKMLLSNRAYRL